MALTQIDYPVTGSAGSYLNIFPSQKPLYTNFKREDGTLLSIVSGVDAKVRVAINETFENLLVGDVVIFFSDGYPLQKATVVSIIDASTIELNIPFASSTITNGFINYHKNWFVEIRYVDQTSSSNNQDAIEILEDYSQIPSSLNGNVRANIALPSDLISADFTITEGEQQNLFTSYKIQYRQSYNAQRAGAWISPSVDIPILLVHSADNVTIGFTDPNVSKRYAKGYPLNYMYVYSSINDAGSNTIKFNLIQYALNKDVISTTEYASFNNLNGVFNLLVDTSDLEAATRFIEFTTLLISSGGQYDPTQYDPTQYA